MSNVIGFKASQVNLCIQKGSTFREKIIWATREIDENGQEVITPVDLTDCEAALHIKKQINFEEILFELTTLNGGISIDGPAGEIELYISADDTTNFTWFNAVYDLEIYFPNSDIKKLLYGKVTAVSETIK